jgi:D-3-phosphoglycerate dehydrogenase / 2-oxoglutarate reductase
MQDAETQSKSRPRIWMEAGLHPDALAQLREQTEVVASRDVADLRGCAAMIVGGNRRVDGPLLDLAGPELLAVARPGIGVDAIDVTAASERGVLVINTPDAPTESTAEHAVALMLALAKRVVEGDRWLRGARDQGLSVGIELRDLTLGVVGLGRIGRRVAEIAGAGLRMLVLGFDPYVGREEAESFGVEKVADLDEMLSRSDVVSLHVPATGRTRGFIGDAALGQMKPTAILINASRGSVVDEMALARALTEGRLAGAALDVFHTEPPPPDHPLLALPNVIVTPHIASRTGAGLTAMSDGTVAQLLQVLHGEQPPNLVNPEVWPGRVKESKKNSKQPTA